jgi:peptidoglycan/xylan/chitin deacetylase (PgdA/CDA1 family)
MRGAAALACVLALVASAAGAHAAGCPDNPDALGTSRILAVDPGAHRRLGTMQYRETLPLLDKEVVLTFDDGPLQPYSQRVLDALAAECVKATYFLVGRMARSNPDMVRRIAAAGHTIGTHTENHPYRLDLVDQSRAEHEVNAGIAAAAAALGSEHMVAPFFRFPGLRKTEHLEAYLDSRAIMTWSADFPADDWRGISGHEVTARALQRLEAKGKGILLLHDIQPATALALPGLLRELKARGFRVVHVVPAGAEQPVTATLPEQWRPNRPARMEMAARLWPRVIERGAADIPSALAAPSLDSLGVGDALQTASAIHLASQARRAVRAPAWPMVMKADGSVITAALPAPAAEQFRYLEMVQPAAATLDLRLAIQIAALPKRPRRAVAQSPAPKPSEPALETAARPWFLFPFFEPSEPGTNRRARSSQLHP